jgi:hypothetical protein
MRIKIIYEEFSILMRIEEDTYIKNILSFYRKIKFLGIKENTILHLINHENKIMNEKDIIKFTLNKNLYLKSEEFFIKENIKCKKLNIKRIYKIPKENIFYLILIEKIYPNFKYSSLDQFYSNDKDIKNSERYNNLTFLIMKTTDAKEKIEIKQRPIRNSLFTNINNINNRKSNNYDPNFPSFLDIIESFENYSNNNSNIFPLIIRDERNNLMHMYLENYETYFSHRNRSFDNPLRSRSISISRSISESNESNINNRNRSIEFSNDSIDNNNNNNEENDSDFIHESFNNNYSNIIPDPNMINSLVELGFSREISINALRMVGNDITAATDLILSDLINLENIQERYFILN